MEGNKQLGIIILAAGKASRMGKPKALLPYKGNSFLFHTSQLAKSLNPSVLTCVLGHYYEPMSAHCLENNIPFILNHEYEKGMSESIKCGLLHVLTTFPDLNMVLILLADQPKIDRFHLSAMLQRIRKHKLLLVCTSYSSTLGVPALFSKELFEEILEINGEKGAKTLIQKFAINALNAILYEEGHIDIDTPSDYEKLIKMEKLAK
jgi:molybdenum cofactor cytidylyltransferase